MGATNAQLFSRLSDSLNVRHVRDLMVSVLGLQISADPQTTAGDNGSCFQDCSSSPECLNDTCICPVSLKRNYGKNVYQLGAVSMRQIWGCVIGVNGLECKPQTLCQP